MYPATLYNDLDYQLLIWRGLDEEYSISKRQPMEVLLMCSKQALREIRKCPESAGSNGHIIETESVPVKLYVISTLLRVAATVSSEWG